MNKFNLITLLFSLLLVNNCVNADGFSIIGEAQSDNTVNNKQNLSIVRKSSFDNLKPDSNIINKNMVKIDARTSNIFGTQASNHAGFVASSNNNFALYSNVQSNLVSNAESTNSKVVRKASSNNNFSISSNVQSFASKPKVDFMNKQENNNDLCCVSSASNMKNAPSRFVIESTSNNNLYQVSSSSSSKSFTSELIEESANNNNLCCKASPKKSFSNLQIDNKIHEGNMHEINACKERHTKSQKENFQGLVVDIVNIINNERNDYLKSYGYSLKRVNEVEIQIVHKKDNRVVRTINIPQKNEILKQVIKEMNESRQLHGNPLENRILSITLDNMILMDNSYRTDKLLNNIVEMICKQASNNKNAYIILSDQLINIWKRYREIVNSSSVNSKEFSIEKQSELKITNDDEKIKKNIKDLNTEQKELLYENMLNYTIEKTNDLKIEKQSLEKLYNDDKASQDDKIFALCKYNMGNEMFLNNFMVFGNVWTVGDIVMKIFVKNFEGNNKSVEIVKYSNPMIKYFYIPMPYTFNIYSMLSQFNFIF